jgi:L-ascorbate metabolism protein UlaG (beta-lactamase superfamily)
MENATMNMANGGITRRQIIGGMGASVVVTAAGCSTFDGGSDLAQWQKEIDEVTPDEYFAYLEGRGERRFAALDRLDKAFGKVLEEVKSTTVQDRPALWLVYNMGIIVKTRETLFSVDLCHRRANEIAPLLDFALITHNHNDHYTRRFYDTMDRRLRKTVVNNFDCNYGARATPYQKGTLKSFGGGYTRGGKIFNFRDVEIRTYVSDHNPYLIGYTMPFEIFAGGFTIFHSGDSARADQLNPSRTPDLWIVHPRVGLMVDEGVRRFSPKTTVIAHLNEFTHPADKWRWKWEDGFVEKARVESAGGRAIVPVWGERIV